MPTVHMETKAAGTADYERSDVCAVPAAGVVVESVVAFEIARSFVEKFGGDSITEMRTNYENYLQAGRALG